MSKNTLKILTYMGESGPLTGAPRRLLTLVKGLRDKKFVVTIAAPKDSELYKIEDLSGFAPIDTSPKGVLALKNKQLLTNRSLLFRLKVFYQLFKSNLSFYKKIKSGKFDVIWIRGSSSFAKYGLALFFSRVKVIWDVDDELPSHGVVRLLHEAGMFLSHKIIFQYKGTEENTFNKSLSKRYKDKYLTLIPGIETLKLQPQEISTDFDEVVKIIHVGTINKRKNQLFTLKLLGTFKEKYPSQDFIVEFAGFISEKSYKSELDIIIQKYGLKQNVKFLGWRDDATSLVASSDILLMPSLSEGVPNTIQEAMTLGVTVIGSTAGGIPEIIENNKTGYSIELENFSAWLSTLEKLVCNSKFRNKIGHNAREYALQNFDNKVWVDKYYAIINELVNK